MGFRLIIQRNKKTGVDIYFLDNKYHFLRLKVLKRPYIAFLIPAHFNRCCKKKYEAKNINPEKITTAQKRRKHIFDIIVYF